jgi:hypothetical protein
MDVRSELMSAYPWGWTMPSAKDANGKDTGAYASDTLTFKDANNIRAARSDLTDLHVKPDLSHIVTHRAGHFRFAFASGCEGRINRVDCHQVTQQFDCRFMHKLPRFAQKGFRILPQPVQVCDSRILYN